MQLRRVLLPALLALSLGACAGDRPANLGNAFENSTLTGMLDGVKNTRLNDKFIRAGIKAIEEGDYVTASESFSRALKFDPANANLHFLNGLSYHLRAEAGDGSQYEMAMVGYKLALKYDPGNDWAAYLAGHIMLRKQHYRKAQDAFAYALLNAPDNVAYLKAMATASYYSQDIESALTAIDKAVALAPDDRDALYNQVLIEAAAGGMNKADKLLSVYQKGPATRVAFSFSRLTRRLGDWRRFYRNKSYLKKVQSTSDIFGSSDTSSDGGGDSGDGSGSDSSSVDSGSDFSTDSNTNSGTDSNTNSGTDSSGNSARPSVPRMTLVDVVIIRSEERLATTKGVNLLSGLSVALSSANIATFNKTNQLMGTTGSTSTLVWAVPLNVTASYVLNIFNDNNDRDKVLARPTLVAMDGQTSDFFSGAVWHIQLSGGSGTDGSVTDVPIGIKLSVTPNFIDDNTIKFQVSASRAFVDKMADGPTFTTFAQTTRTKININAVVKFGETLVLSGLDEKETENIRDGVPFLQNIPIIQYLFSNEAALKYTKSVLILMTPRKPRYTYADGSPKAARIDNKKVRQPNLDELKNRLDWFKPASTVDAILWRLKDVEYFKEFRSGDVRTEKWNSIDNVGKMLMRSIQFLYY